MNRKEALNTLGLPETAGPEHIEQAYRKLVRRYPPEFHPEKFRAVDEAYRILSSIAHLVVTHLSPRAVGAGVTDQGLLTFEPQQPSAEDVEQTLTDMERSMKRAYLLPE